MSDAVISLVILAFVIILFISRIIPSAVTAIVGCLAFAACGICTPKEAFSGFSNTTVILVAGMMVLGSAMKETGFSDTIGRKLSALAGNSERKFILLAGVASGFLSAFLTNTAVIALFLPIIMSVCSAKETPGNSSFKKMNGLTLTLPVSMGAMFGGTCTLIGSTPQLTAQGILENQMGITLGIFDYTLPGILLFSVYLIYVLLIGYPIGNRIWKSRAENGDFPHTNEKTAIGTASDDCRRKRVLVSVIFVATIVFFIGGWLDPSLTATGAAILCILCRCITFENAIKSINATAVFVLAGSLGIATGIANSGFDHFLGDYFSGLFGQDMSGIVIFAVFVCCTMLVSNFVMNSTAVVIFLPIALSLCQIRGFNPELFTLGIVFAANLSYSTPLANAQTGMTIAAGYRYSDYFRYTLILDILVLASIIVFFPIIFPL